MHTVTMADMLNTAKDIARINHAMAQALTHLANITETTAESAQLTILSAAAELSSDKAISLTEVEKY